MQGGRAYADGRAGDLGGPGARLRRRSETESHHGGKGEDDPSGAAIDQQSHDNLASGATPT